MEWSPRPVEWKSTSSEIGGSPWGLSVLSTDRNTYKDRGQEFTSGRKNGSWSSVAKIQLQLVWWGGTSVVTWSMRLDPAGKKALEIPNHKVNSLGIVSGKGWGRTQCTWSQRMCFKKMNKDKYSCSGLDPEDVNFPRVKGYIISYGLKMEEAQSLAQYALGLLKLRVWVQGKWSSEDTSDK